jgi:hypothetical protein
MLQYKHLRGRDFAIVKYEDLFNKNSYSRRKILSLLDLQDHDLDTFEGEKYGELNALDPQEQEFLSLMFDDIIHDWDSSSIDYIVERKGPIDINQFNEKINHVLNKLSQSNSASNI